MSSRSAGTMHRVCFPNSVPWSVPVAYAILSIILVTVARGQDLPVTNVRIDLNQDTPRGDVRSDAWENWRVTEGEVARFTAGPLTFELKAQDAEKPLKTMWWKPGFDYPARMASDGVVCSGRVTLTVTGLPSGEHSLAVYHNALENDVPSPINVICSSNRSTVTPSHRVTHDEDATASYFRATLQRDEPFVIAFHPRTNGQVVLNGIELNRSDPHCRARSPSPSDGDEHVEERPVLRWRPAFGAKKHVLYVGESHDAVARATTTSPEFRGQTNESQFALSEQDADARRNRYWRVDTEGESGAVRGEVWMFRIRRLAFHDAEGYGRFAIGGRAGRVLEVTNLNDSGPGSLREAVDATGPRVVVFRVGGLIALQSKIIIRNPYLTIAGQTAPGDGICLKNYTVGCSDTHDVIVQHLRIRVGDESGTTQDGCGARGCDHVIFDHCSISWSIDEGFSSREARNITVQRCLIAEALHLADHKKYKGTGKGHSFAGSISGNIGSFHHNLLAHCTGRNWSLAGGLDRTDQRLAGRLDIRNNVVFNWRDRTTDGGVRELVFADNFYLPGPATKVFSLLKPDPGDAGRGMRAFLAGNEVEGHPAITQDNWSAFVGSTADLHAIKVDSPLWAPHVKSHRPSELLDVLLDDVGATRPLRDAVDRRIVADVRARKSTYSGSRGGLPGIIDSQKDAGGWPEYRSAPAPADRDRDGLPDDWEVAQQLDPDQPVDSAQYAADGFTHLERYLFELTKR